jgi:hypothetical protein
MMSAPAPADKQAMFNHPHFVEKSSRDIPLNTLDAAIVLPTNRADARQKAIIGRSGCPDSIYIRCAKKA